MFDLGIQELIVIFVVALLVFGPKRLPEIAQSIGRGLAELKKAMSGIKEQIDSELHEVKDISKLKELDPLALKEELFKSDQLIRTDEEQEQPQHKADEPQGEASGIDQEKNGGKNVQPPEANERKGPG